MAREDLLHQLKKIRQEAKVSATTLAEETGIGKSVILRWERKETEPKIYAFDEVLYELGYELAIVPIKEGNKQ